MSANAQGGKSQSLSRGLAGDRCDGGERRRDVRHPGRLRWLATQPRRTLPLLVAAFAIAAPNVHAGVPYVTDDGDVTETGHVEIDVAGQITHRTGETSGVLPSLDLRACFSTSWYAPATNKLYTAC